MSDTHNDPDGLAPMIMTERELDQYCKVNNLYATEGRPFCSIRSPLVVHRHLSIQPGPTPVQRKMTTIKKLFNLVTLIIAVWVLVKWAPDHLAGFSRKPDNSPWVP